jgi:HD-GYP domain-containing protein (c-di-GMP phosphodiesterase class II)
VHSHHERLDGKGYPRGLAECDLSLDTGILTVCDVYDALVSPRVYPDAWMHEDAVALLHKDTGTAFDERCVAALERVLSGEEATNVTRLPSLVPSVHPSAAAAS